MCTVSKGGGLSLFLTTLLRTVKALTIDVQEENFSILLYTYFCAVKGGLVKPSLRNILSMLATFSMKLRIIFVYVLKETVLSTNYKKQKTKKIFL